MSVPKAYALQWVVHFKGLNFMNDQYPQNLRTSKKNNYTVLNPILLNAHHTYHVYSLQGTNADVLDFRD